MFSKDNKILGSIDVNALAISTQFMKRVPKKISPYHFLLSFCLACSMPCFSLRVWAFQLSQLIGQGVSHQALHKKLQIRHFPFMRQMFQLLVRHNMGLGGQIPQHLRHFSRIWIEDSSCVRLGQALFHHFSGNSNGKVRKTIGRIQLAFDLKADTLQHLDLTSYSINDAAYSDRVLTHIGAGDLVIRDLGYWKLCVFEKLHQAGAYFLSRLKLSCCLYTHSGQTEWSLVKTLKKYDRKGLTTLDQWVCVGAKEKVPMRLMGYKLTPQQAQAKRKAARISRHKNSKMSTDTHYLMSWNLFVTNVDAKVWGLQQVYPTYQLRWSIEMMFKNWKSNFHIESIIASTTGPDPIRPEILMYLCLIYLASVYQPYYHYFNRQLMQQYQRILSPLKFAQFLQHHLTEFIPLEIGTRQTPKIDRFLDRLARYYCYEKRKDRINLVQLSGRSFP